MTTFTTSGIMLRRIEHGDYDFIITFLTTDLGKISVIAKNAKKSVRRFGGILELFSQLDLVCQQGKGKLPVLKEASLRHAHYDIRRDIGKTAYASYFAEIINAWMEEGRHQDGLYDLLEHALGMLDHGSVSQEELSILFQMRFLILSGLTPNLNQCCNCKTALDDLRDISTIADLKRGGVVCELCGCDDPCRRTLSKGTIKQLLWIMDSDLEKAGRMKFTRQAVREGLAFLEAFVSFYMGRDMKSLKFLRKIR